MKTPPAPTSLYVTRWKAFLITLFFAGLLLGGLLSYFVWSTPAVQTHPELDQEPAKTLIVIVWTLMCAVLGAVGLYWTLTSRPLLQLNATTFVYRAFPRPTCTICWDDVESLFAYRHVRRRGVPAKNLTLRFTCKPHRLSADQAPSQVRLDIPMQVLSLSADELIERISSYHHLHSLYTPKGIHIAMTAELLNEESDETTTTSTTSTDSTSSQER